MGKWTTWIMFLCIISPTSGSFQLVIPQTLNNSPLVDLYMTLKLVLVYANGEVRLVRAGVELGLR